MPPHCDSMDGPVVTAAEAALEAADVGLVLPYVPEAAEVELVEAFERALAAREGTTGDARALVDRWLFEQAVRLHRAGEGEPFTGLKPAGLDVGPVIPLAEAAVESGEAEALVGLLGDTVADEVGERLRRVVARRRASDGSVEAERAAVSAALGFEVWAHHLYGLLRSGEPHGEGAVVAGDHGR